MTIDEIFVQLPLEVAQSVTNVRGASYDFEHVGTVGPFKQGRANEFEPQTTPDYLNVEGLIRGLKARLSSDREIAFVIPAGKVDKRQFKAPRQNGFRSNRSLAQNRASWVKDALLSDPILKMKKEKVLAIVAALLEAGVRREIWFR